jgi:SAM-dependent methyltransferase
MDPAIESHYGTGYERDRLFSGRTPALEFVRSLELLYRLLPAPPARVLDVGGGPGTYAAPLARRGYRVHLVDAMPLHVEQAREVAAAVATESRALPGHRGVPGPWGPGARPRDSGVLPQISTAGSDPAAAFTALLGDARDLPEPAGSQDAVLLLGPLYHLTEAGHRRQALAEAWRVLRPGGRLLAVAISRFASLLDGVYQDWLDDPQFRRIVGQDLSDGQHRNPDPVSRPEWFTTAYFHTPDGLASEVEQVGFTGTALYGVEGPGWPLREEWADPRRREQILFAARAVETQPAMLGFSMHVIAAATRP